MKLHSLQHPMAIPWLEGPGPVDSLSAEQEMQMFLKVALLETPGSQRNRHWRVVLRVLHTPLHGFMPGPFASKCSLRIEVAADKGVIQTRAGSGHRVQRVAIVCKTPMFQPHMRPWPYMPGRLALDAHGWAYSKGVYITLA